MGQIRLKALISRERWRKRIKDGYATLTKDNLHRRIFKCVFATGITVLIALLPNIRNVYGPAAYLGCMTSVFGHPGRRLGGMLEAVGIATVGISVGVAWMTLGTYLAGLCRNRNPSATMGIKAVFLAIAMFVHGYVRSTTPRLFVGVLLMAIPCLLGLTNPTMQLTASFVKMFFYPMMTAVGVLLLVNVLILPEFGTTAIGMSTIQTLQLTVKILTDSAEFFVESRGNNPIGRPLPHQRHIQHKKVIKLAELTAAKPALRAKVAECKSVYRDSAYDISFSCLAPKELKNITGKRLSRLAMNVAALVGSCESKYSLMGTLELKVSETEDINRDRAVVDDDMEQETDGVKAKSEKEKEKQTDEYVPRLKVKRAIEYGDEQLLRHLLLRVAKPVNNLKESVLHSMDIVSLGIGYVYGSITSSQNLSKAMLIFFQQDVENIPLLRIPDGKIRPPGGILLQELDIYIDSLSRAIDEFASASVQALDGAALYNEQKGLEVDVMPRDEVFLISSFMLNLRLAASHTLDMLKHTRYLIELRQDRKSKRRFHWPDVSLKKWLYTGTEDTEALNLSGTSGPDGQADQDDDDEDGDGENDETSTPWGTALVNDPTDNTPTWESVTREKMEKSKAIRERKRIAMLGYSKKNFKPWKMRVREGIADFIDWIRYSDNVIYAIKFAFGILLLSWPAFVPSWARWYELARGVWVPFIFILVFENAVGSTVWIFFLRAVGTLFGSIWGYAAYQCGKGNEISMGIMLVIGSIPAYYVQVGTRYMKAAMVCTVSMCVVAISTHLQTVPGTSFENFYKRMSASLIGGVAALLVQIILFPVKARVKLKHELSKAISAINLMESCVALGVDDSSATSSNNVARMLHDPRFLQRFERAGKKASNALTAAQAFLDYTQHEPRLKGSFEAHRQIYTEILFVLRQIVERMENLVRLRIAYGSAVLEEFNARVHGYRRNVAAAITLTLYAVSQSLMQKLPLPQFLPSARLAHLRMVVRVRQILHEESLAAIHSANAVEGMNSNHHHLQSMHMTGTTPPNNTPYNSPTPNTNHTSGTIPLHNPNPNSNLPIITIAGTSDHSHQSGHTHANHHLPSLPLPSASAVARQRALRLKILSWNASSAALEECVEYVEELVDLVKMLVGVNEFRSGLLHRPTFREYLKDVYGSPVGLDGVGSGPRRRKVGRSGHAGGAGGGEGNGDGSVLGGVGAGGMSMASGTISGTGRWSVRSKLRSYRGGGGSENNLGTHGNGDGGSSTLPRGRASPYLDGQVGGEVEDFERGRRVDVAAVVQGDRNEESEVQRDGGETEDEEDEDGEGVATATLPHPLMRIQTRREAERNKRKNE